MSADNGETDGHSGSASAIRRKEDPPLITGRGSYTDDIVAARDAVGGVRPLARGAREDHLDRHRAPPTACPACTPSSPARTSSSTSPACRGLGAARRSRSTTPEHWPLAQGRGQARRRPGRGRRRRGPLRRRRRRRGRRRRVRRRCRSSSTRRPRSRTARRSSTSSSARTRSTSGRSAPSPTTLEAGVRPRPTSSSSGGSSTTARAGAPIEPRAVLADFRAGDLTVYELDAGPALPAALPRADRSGLSEEQHPRRSRPTSAAASAASCRSTARRSSAPRWPGSSTGRSSGSRRARSTCWSPTTAATRSTTCGSAPSSDGTITAPARADRRRHGRVPDAAHAARSRRSGRS